MNVRIWRTKVIFVWNGACNYFRYRIRSWLLLWLVWVCLRSRIRRDWIVHFLLQTRRKQLDLNSWTFGRSTWWFIVNQTNLGDLLQSFFRLTHTQSVQVYVTFYILWLFILISYSARVFWFEVRISNYVVDEETSIIHLHKVPSS